MTIRRANPWVLAIWRNGYWIFPAARPASPLNIGDLWNWILDIEIGAGRHVPSGSVGVAKTLLRLGKYLQSTSCVDVRNAGVARWVPAPGIEPGRAFAQRLAKSPRLPISPRRHHFSDDEPRRVERLGRGRPARSTEPQREDSAVVSVRRKQKRAVSGGRFGNSQQPVLPTLNVQGRDKDSALSPLGHWREWTLDIGH